MAARIALILAAGAVAAVFVLRMNLRTNVARLPAAQRANVVAPHALDTLATGLVAPWALAFAPDGRIFLTERPGRIRVIEHDSLRAEPWAVLEVAAAGEAGLMGIAVSPDFESDRAVYVVATFRTAAGELDNRVLRLREQDGRGAAPEVIVDGLPAARFHAGAALAFGPDGMLYVTTGDAQTPAAAADMSSLAGKLLRYTPDGGIPDDNPFAGSPVWALGLRNTQGIAWHPRTGDIIATDHGPSGFPNERFRRDNDELNVLARGLDYGWPAVAGTGGPPNTVDPIAVWTPAIAPAGIAIYDGDEFRAWRGHAFVTGLRGRQLRRIVLERDARAPTGWRVTGEESLFHNQLGRLRAVAVSPEGRLHLGTSNRDGRGTPAAGDDRILRVRPLR